jgi:aryl-alcohol dehydrogenase-like predicted oxidoreductase
VHAWDFTTPLDELMRGLDDLVRQGKVLYVGISDTPAWVVSRANMLADQRGWTPFSALQLRYSLIDRAAERDLLPMARALDLAVTPWSVLGAGVLTGKYNRDHPPEDGRAAGGAATVERNLEIAETVIGVAEDIGATPSQVALRWAMQRPGLILPLVGARTEEQIHDNLCALDIELSEGHMDTLNEVSSIELGFPHDFLRQDGIRNVVYGGTYDQIVNHRHNGRQRERASST